MGGGGNSSSRHTIKERFEKAFKIGGGHGVVELGQGGYGGGYPANTHATVGNGHGGGAQGDPEAERERQAKRHASKPGLGASWGKFRSGVFGQGH